MQSGDIPAKEHNSVGTYCKKELMYGWYNGAPIKIAVTAAGLLKITV